MTCMQRDNLMIRRAPLLCLCVLLTLSACHRREAVGEERVVRVSTLTVSEGLQSSHREYAATLEEAAASTLSFGVGGQVTAVFVKEGQRVRAGQLLATVDRSTAENAYKAAKATLDQAQDGYNRAKQVYDSGSLPEVRWIEVQTQLNRAQSMCDIAKKNLDDCSLYAPSAGTVDSRSIERGSSVTAFQPVMRLLDLSRLYVKMSVPEVDIHQIHVGDSVTVEVNALPEAQRKPLHGIVEEQGVTADMLSHSYMVRIRLLAPTDDLLPGMVCRVRMAGPRTGHGIEVPARAVQLDHRGQRFVWVVDGGTAQKRPVAIGDLTRTGVLVDEGLREGDTVIVDGTMKVATGTRVTTN